MGEFYTYEKLVDEQGVQKADRLAFIDFVLHFNGSVSRKELADFFGIKEASSSSAISDYKKLRPDNVDYNRSLGKNEILRTTFKPLIDIDAETALGMLANGFNKNKLKSAPLVPYERVGTTPRSLDVNIIAKVSRAINRKAAIECCYLSASSSNHSSRLLFPTAIFYDGTSWMFRAYHKHDDSQKSAFKCFNFSRLDKVTERPDLPAAPEAQLGRDSDWNTIIPVILSPHPDLGKTQVDVLRHKFGFEQESENLIVNVRAPLFFYLAIQWKIDVSDYTSSELNVNENHSANYNFLLKNRETLLHFHCMEHVFN